MLKMESVFRSRFYEKPLFWVVIALFFSILGANTYYRGAVSEKQRTDLTVFFRAAEGIKAHENIYDIKTIRQWNYVYLPLLANLLLPFTEWPQGAKVAGWYIVSVLLLAILYPVCLRFYPNKDWASISFWLAGVAAFPPLINTLTRGQLGITSLVFAMVAFYFYVRKKDYYCGLMLAFSIVLKLSPSAFLIFFFLFKREWKVLLSAAAGFLFFIWIYPGWILGAETNLFYLKEWWRVTHFAVSSRAHEGILWQQLVTPFAEDNQSLQAVITRLYYRDEQDYIQHLSPWLGRIVKAFLIISLLLLAKATWNTRRFPRSMSRLLLEYSLFPLLMLLGSPVTQNHHYTMLFLIFLAVFLYQKENISEGWKKKMLRGVWISAGFFWMGWIIEKCAYLGFPVWGVLGLFILSIAFLNSQRELKNENL